MIGTIKRIKRKVENMKVMQMKECKGEEKKNGRGEGKLELRKRTSSKRKTGSSS